MDKVLEETIRRFKYKAVDLHSSKENIINLVLVLDFLLSQRNFPQTKTKSLLKNLKLKKP